MASKIITLHTPIANYKNFNQNMINKGYSNFTSNFLVKQFEGITINITRNNQEITAITGYDETQDVVDIPENILTEVNTDIEDSNI